MQPAGHQSVTYWLFWMQAGGSGVLGDVTNTHNQGVTTHAPLLGKAPGAPPSTKTAAPTKEGKGKGVQRDLRDMFPAK
jgi:hypothetical protein